MSVDGLVSCVVALSVGIDGASFSVGWHMGSGVVLLDTVPSVAASVWEFVAAVFLSAVGSFIPTPFCLAVSTMLVVSVCGLLPSLSTFTVSVYRSYSLTEVLGVASILNETCFPCLKHVSSFPRH